MSITDRWSSEDDYIDCADEEETWDLIRDVLESAKDQLSYWSLEATGVSSAY